MLWQKYGFVNKWCWRLQEVKREMMSSVFLFWAVRRTLAALPAAHTRGQEACSHRNVLGLSVTARWKYSGGPSDCRLPLGFLKLLPLSSRFSKLDTIISARSCWSLWKFSLIGRGISEWSCFYCVCLIIVKWGSRCAVNTRFHSRCRWCWKVVCFPHHSC